MSISQNSSALVTVWRVVIEKGVLLLLNQFAVCFFFRLLASLGIVIVFLSFVDLIYFDPKYFTPYLFAVHGEVNVLNHLPDNGKIYLFDHVFQFINDVNFTVGPTYSLHTMYHGQTYFKYQSATATNQLIYFNTWRDLIVRLVVFIDGIINHYGSSFYHHNRKE